MLRGSIMYPFSQIHSTSPSCAFPVQHLLLLEYCRHYSATLLLFWLLTFTPKSVAGYRYPISEAPVDKRNFSHIYTLTAILGS